MASNAKVLESIIKMKYGMNTGATEDNLCMFSGDKKTASATNWSFSTMLINLSTGITVAPKDSSELDCIVSETT